MEGRPAAAKVLFTPPKGHPRVVEAAGRVQTEATASLVALLAAERDLLPGAGDRDLRLELFMEFIKVGLHGLAAWWTDHPDTPRAALVEASMALARDGLRSQFEGPSGQEGASQVGQAGVGPGLSEVSVEVGGSLRRNLTPC